MACTQAYWPGPHWTYPRQEIPKEERTLAYFEIWPGFTVSKQNLKEHRK